MPAERHPLITPPRPARWLILPALALVLTLAGAALLIRALPNAYAPEAVRALLAPPPDCPMPCWAGIQPGQTRGHEALTALDGNTWVRAVTTQRDDLHARSDFWTWEWSGAQSPLLDGTRTGGMSVVANGEVIEEVRFYTTVPLGVAFLALGDPDAVYVNRSARGVQVSGFYLDDGLIVRANWDCPADRWAIWAAPVLLRFTPVANPENVDHNEVAYTDADC